MSKPKIILTEKRNRVEIKAKGEVIRFSCCDCRLTHDVAIVLEKNGSIGLAFKRNQKQTLINRKSWSSRCLK